MIINPATKGKGAKKAPVDLRDYRLEKVVSLKATIIPEEFSYRDKIGKIKDQGGSDTCVSQAFAYYAEVLNTFEIGEKIELSARDIYSLIFLPEGGAYLRDGAKKITKSGVILEKDAPSYENGVMPPSEDFMRKRDDIIPEEAERGMTYLAKSYVTWQKRNWETFKKAIFLGKGAVCGAMGNNYTWRTETGIVSVPEDNPDNWGHAVLFTGVKKINNKEYLEFVNSWGNDWGDNAFGYMSREYVESGLTFDPITLIDLPNAYYSAANKVIFLLKNLISLYQELIRKIKYGAKKFIKGR